MYHFVDIFSYLSDFKNSTVYSYTAYFIRETSRVALGRSKDIFKPSLGHSLEVCAV